MDRESIRSVHIAPMIYTVEKHLANAYFTARCKTWDGWSTAMSSGHGYSPRLWQGGSLIVSTVGCPLSTLENAPVSRHGSLPRSMPSWAYDGQLPCS
ncbi:Uncharacterized protein HZ326_15252 [Fusarium oxysporum f. sp. albedinis]|nr:Uncharacterized protein HZ326_15252 [Fusarium oxysporum f. sp. albedinis]